jgi:hypothetical protein
MWHVMETGEVYTGLWCGDLREIDHFEGPGVDEKIIFRWIFRKWDVGAWTGLMWLRIGVGGGHLWVRQWTLVFNKMRGISWLAEDPLALKKDSAPWSDFSVCVTQSPLSALSKVSSGYETSHLMTETLSKSCVWRNPRQLTVSEVTVMFITSQPERHCACINQHTDWQNEES